MRLPSQPQELRTFLVTQSARFQSAIEQAERQRRREDAEARLKVIDDHMDQLIAQSGRLKQLGLRQPARDAAELITALQQERHALCGILAQSDKASEPSSPQQRTTQELPPDEPATSAPTIANQPLSHPPASVQAAESGQLPVSEPKSVPTTITVRTPACSTADGFNPAQSTLAIHQTVAASELPREVDFLIQRAEALQRNGVDMEPREVQLEVQLLVYEGRALQDLFPVLLDSKRELGSNMHSLFFGRLTRLSADRLKEAGLYVEGLRASDRGDWGSLRKRADADLHEFRQQKKQRQEQEHARAESARQRQQVSEANRRAYEDLLGEIADICLDPSHDEIWADELRAVVEDALKYCERDYGQLAQILEPHAALFSGPVFRPLRKRWNKANEADASGRFDAVKSTGAEAAGPAPRVLPQMTLQWKDWGKGKRAAIVGGSCREYRRRQLQEFLGFDELEWIENERTETANGANLAQRVRNHRYDVVFLLNRFCSHELQNHLKPACKESGVPFASVERGYGINAVCAALDACGHYARGPA